MRPHELTLRGFRSYRDEVTFDFRGRHLVGIVGPIGAGKSSILDGIAFALFGKTPRVQKETKSLIHQLSDSAHVRLTFEVDGQTWQVTRALKRKGQGQVQLVHLGDGRRGGGDGRDGASRSGSGSSGCSGWTSTRSVDRSCWHRIASPSSSWPATLPRNAVLKGVFGYERFDAALTAAREHVARREATVAALDADGARLTQARAALEEARTAAADAVATTRSVRGLAAARRGSRSPRGGGGRTRGDRGDRGGSCGAGGRDGARRGDTRRHARRRPRLRTRRRQGPQRPSTTRRPLERRPRRNATRPPSASATCRPSPIWSPSSTPGPKR